MSWGQIVGLKANLSKYKKITETLLKGGELDEEQKLFLLKQGFDKELLEGK